MAVRLAAVLVLLAPTAAAATEGGVPIGGLGIALMAVGGGLLFLLSLLAARKARTPKARPPPKKSFERGRELGRLAGVVTEQDAVRALASAPVGKLVSVAPVPRGYKVTMSRRRSEPCEVAAGYVAGLFETAWARDVVLRHDACAGKARGAVCTYEVRDPSPRAVSPGGAPAGGASTPRSADERRRWPPARPGGAG
ncbi:MAG TPA: hypothetical protein VNX21_06195 [Candidatus Thermoplasmatota archaeon]|nr:hypothetical protein [Candidatus Thermoplasmatota archaeon]